ncbi:MAG: hypothetical protein QOK31_1481 [Solirubrobacteraceae bacterium]|jgi:uncharacterized protein|nr:hypothetical protein [Solirubrobacteraceae bacterium]
MAQRTDSFDLARLRLTTGEARRLDLEVVLDPVSFGGERYVVRPASAPVRVDVSRTTGLGYALRVRFTVALVGPCMRCLEPAELALAVDAREVSQRGGIDELTSPYVDEEEQLDVAGWARDALVLALPAQILCVAECAGLCAVCGENLNTAGGEHGHEREPDPRWAKLRELKLD